MDNKETPAYINRCEIICTANCDLKQILKKLNDAKFCAYILHDKENTTPHYHVFIDFGETFVVKSNIAKLFKVQNNKIYEITASREDMLVYLTHKTKKGDLHIWQI